MQTEQGKNSQWAAEGLRETDQAMNSPIGGVDYSRALFGLAYLPFFLFAKQKSGPWPDSFSGWLLLLGAPAVFVLAVYLVLRGISSFSLRSPLKLRHWVRVGLAIVLLPLTAWACGQAFV